MGSKSTLLFFCISLAIALMITSDVAASRQELAETSTSVNKAKTKSGLDNSKNAAGGSGELPDLTYGGGNGGYPGDGNGGSPGGGWGGYGGGRRGGYSGYAELRN